MATLPPDDRPPTHDRGPDRTARGRRSQTLTVAILLAVAAAVVLVLLL
jgi:hypothetical protein